MFSNKLLIDLITNCHNLKLRSAQKPYNVRLYTNFATVYNLLKPKKPERIGTV